MFTMGTEKNEKVQLNTAQLLIKCLEADGV
jgi:acetolactate synthase-1/2/3 large subunit